MRRPTGRPRLRRPRPSPISPGINHGSRWKWSEKGEVSHERTSHRSRHGEGEVSRPGVGHDVARCGVQRFSAFWTGYHSAFVRRRTTERGDVARAWRNRLLPSDPAGATRWSARADELRRAQRPPTPRTTNSVPPLECGFFKSAPPSARTARWPRLNAPSSASRALLRGGAAVETLPVTTFGPRR